MLASEHAAAGGSERVAASVLDPWHYSRVLYFTTTTMRLFVKRRAICVCKAYGRCEQLSGARRLATAVMIGGRVMVRTLVGW